MLGCDMIVLKSSGPSLREQGDRMGIYKKRSSTISGRLVYKHTKRKDYLYFVQHSSDKTGHWIVRIRAKIMAEILLEHKFFKLLDVVIEFVILGWTSSRERLGRN